MSYNITNWTVKKIDGFAIQVDKIVESANQGWEPQVAVDNDSHAYQNMESGLAGVVRDGWLEVSEIEVCGEGSGSVVHRWLDNLWQHTRGSLEAVAIWAGGDSISKLVVKDGTHEWEKIDLGDPC